jgi:plasmid stabilization system protein ParE
MRIRWTPAAVADLQNINDYLKERHPRYRDPTIRKLYGVIRELKESPGAAVPDVRKTRERFCFLPCPMWRFIACESRPSKSCGFITPHRTDNAYSFVSQRVICETTKASAAKTLPRF